MKGKKVLMTAKEFLREAERQGVPLSYRTLRLYIQSGLIPYPEKRGRYVGYYDSMYVDKIKAIKKLIQKYNLDMTHVVHLNKIGLNLNMIGEMLDQNPGYVQHFRMFLSKFHKPRRERFYFTIEDLTPLSEMLNFTKEQLEDSNYMKLMKLFMSEWLKSSKRKEREFRNEVKIIGDALKKINSSISK